MNTLSRLTSAAVAAVIALGLSGCAGDAGPVPATGQTAAQAAVTDCAVYPSGLVVAVAVHENAPAPSLPPTVSCRIESTIAAGLPVGLIAVDGEPWQAFPPTVFDISGNSETERDANLKQAVAQVLGAVHDIAARSNGADYLAAGVAASKAARSATPPIGEILIVGSGASDRGAVVVTDDGMSLADPSQVARHTLETAGIAADTFAGQSVTLVSFGETTAPQPAPTVGQSANIPLLWKATFEAYGATVALDTTPRDGAGPETAFTTTPFAVAEYQPYTPGTTEPIVFDSGSALGFRPDSDQLREESAAIEALRPLAAWLNAEPGRSATITGTTASPSPEENDRLSRLRAERIVSILTGELQVSTDALRAVGAGYTASPDDHPDGVVEPGLAALNMTVRIQTVEAP
jgi:outer membrane protein OmpA-like peptidoglycan-associated protein